MWVFVASDRRIGRRVLVSPKYDYVYDITPQGTWVLREDAEWLLSIKYPCPACNNERIRAFYVATPRDVDMAQKPSVKPGKKRS